MVTSSLRMLQPDLSVWLVTSSMSGGPPVEPRLSASLWSSVLVPMSPRSVRPMLSVYAEQVQSPDTAGNCIQD